MTISFVCLLLMTACGHHQLNDRSKAEVIDQIVLDISVENKEGFGIVNSRDIAQVDQQYMTYTVRPRDTLMNISYRIYGHYDRWQEIAEINKERIGETYLIMVGQELTLKVPESQIRAPAQTPYLIKKGDTLTEIAHKLYGDWRAYTILMEYNAHIINDPNQIYIGLTIYYPSKEYVQKRKNAQVSIQNERITGRPAS